MLGVAVRQIPVLVERGCLPTCNPGIRRRIALDSVQYFMERYITAGRIALHARTNARTMGPSAVGTLESAEEIQPEEIVRSCVRLLRTKAKDSLAELVADAGVV